MTKLGNNKAVIRPLKDADTDALITLVGSCYSEYDGVFLDLNDLDSDLKSYASYIANKDGEAFGLTVSDKLIGCIAYAALGEGSYELKRMYLHKDYRGGGSALTLLGQIIDIMQSIKARELHAWSDDRFTRAHRFYAREGFELIEGDTRFLHDISNSTEIHFIKYFK
jgi:putative acetyltransferase